LDKISQFRHPPPFHNFWVIGRKYQNLKIKKDAYMVMEEEIIRVRTPRGNELLGTVVEMLGASRFRVDCSDEKERICRIPGKFKRRVWVRTGDVVLLKPWEVQADERGDIVWRYTPAQVNWLSRRGLLKRS
jgi:translation initiation factor 1A